MSAVRLGFNWSKEYFSGGKLYDKENRASYKSASYEQFNRKEIAGG